MAMKNSTGGFSLLEILVSVGILASVGVLIGQVFFTTAHVNTKTELLKEVKQNGNFALDVMGRSIRNASFIETICPEEAESTESATIRNADGYTTVYRCESDGNVARIASVSASTTGDETVDYLTSGTLTISKSGAAECDDSSLVFSCPALEGGSAVTLSFSLGPVGSPDAVYETVQNSFTATVIPRNQ